MRIRPAVGWSLVSVVIVVCATLWRAPPDAPAIGVGQYVQQEGAAVAQPPTPATSLAAAPPAPTEVVPVSNAAQLEGSALNDARLGVARGALLQMYPDLATHLGLSDREANALINLLAEGLLRKEGDLGERMNLTPGDVAGASEMGRVQQEQQQREEDAKLALLGATRYAAYQEYEQTMPSRQRERVLASMLAQAGSPLTDIQASSLRKLMIDEQRREEGDLKSRPFNPRERADRATERDRRVLEGATGFLDPGQVVLVRARIEQWHKGGSDRSMFDALVEVNGRP